MEAAIGGGEIRGGKVLGLRDRHTVTGIAKGGDCRGDDERSDGDMH